jgi:vancomycin resistance protein VanW
MSLPWRRLLRRYVPDELRLRRVLARRALQDRRSHTRFACEYVGDSGFEHVIAEYAGPLITYPGQENSAAAKRHNLTLAAASMDGVLIHSGEVFAMWRLIGRPGQREGYLPGAAIRDGLLEIEAGGSICLLSTVLYNIALLGGMSIVERHNHSIDLYGPSRYFELGRDATVEYGYLDLRFANPHAFPVVLRAACQADSVVCRLLAPQPAPFTIEIRVDEPAIIPAPVIASGVAPNPYMPEGREGLRIEARRIWHTAEGDRIEPLPSTYHRPVPGTGVRATEEVRA